MNEILRFTNILQRRGDEFYTPGRRILPDKKVGEYCAFMKKKLLENIVKWSFLLCGIAAVGFVLCICLYLVISGVPAIREIGLWNFLFGETWNAPTN